MNWMSQVTIDNPEIHAKKAVDSNGRVYLGADYAGKSVRVTIEVIEE